MNAIKELISNVTYGKCNVDDMYSVDVEWLFLRVREKSVGEEVKPHIDVVKMDVMELEKQ